MYIMKRSERNKAKVSPNQGHPDPHKNEASDHERHVSGSVNVRGEIEAKRPPDLTQEHSTERKEDNAHNKNKFVVEVLTLIAVCIYAGLTAWQGCLTRTAINDAREHFIKDQRPYVFARAGDTVFNKDWKDHPGTPPFSWTVDWINYGKTPAINFYVCINILSDSAAKTLSDRLRSSQDECAEREAGDIIPPGMEGRLVRTFSTKYPFTPEQIEFLQATDNVMAITGLIRYDDLAGRRYSESFCGMRFATGAVHGCEEKYNKMQ
jgi:hypothetical protein